MDKWTRCIAKNECLKENFNCMTEDFGGIYSIDDKYCVFLSPSNSYYFNYNLKIYDNFDFIIIKKMNKNISISCKENNVILMDFKSLNNKNNVPLDLLPLIMKTSSVKQFHCLSLSKIEIPTEYSLSLNEAREVAGSILKTLIQLSSPVSLDLAINILCNGLDKNETKFMSIKDFSINEDKTYITLTSNYNLANNIKDGLHYELARNQIENRHDGYSSCKYLLDSNTSIKLIYQNSDPHNSVFLDSKIVIIKAQFFMFNESYIEWNDYFGNCGSLETLIDIYNNNKLSTCNNRIECVNKLKRDCDFIEELWIKFAGAQITLDDLLLNIDEISNTDCDNLILHNNNQTQLGNVVRYRCKKSDTSCEEDNPFAFLKLSELIPKTKASLTFEIGVFKIINDILTFTTLENLSIQPTQILRFIGATRNPTEYTEIIRKLKFLGCILQLCHTLRSTLHLNQNILSQTVIDSINKYTDISSENSSAAVNIYITCASDHINWKLLKNMKLKCTKIYKSSISLRNYENSICISSKGMGGGNRENGKKCNTKTVVRIK